VSAVVIEAGTVDSTGSIDHSTHSNIFFAPYHGAPENPDAVYVIETNIPPEIKDTSMISKLEEKIAEAKERWGIA
jgi:hypothetical protein